MLADLQCRWMRLTLTSPVIVASLTPISNARIKEHTEFFVKAAECGAGAVVLPSINSSRHGVAEYNSEIVDVYIGNTEIRKNGPMAFAIQGPTDPNIVSVEYGLTLAKCVKEKLEDIPVIASITNIGDADSILDAVIKLNETDIDGFELNFSCPNVVTSIGDSRNNLPDIIDSIKKVTNKPISLKITPYQDYTDVLEQIIGQIDSLTLANAYIGLAPPDINNRNLSPFQKSDCWAPGGVYGPFERLLTFNRIVQFGHDYSKRNIDIACVGGIVSGEDAIQALLLGANVIQISSGIFWNGLSVLRIMNESIRSYLKQTGYKNATDIIGLALPFIKSRADDCCKQPKKRLAKVKTDVCKACSDCFCVDRLCFAITRGGDGRTVVDEELCSGCGWCVSNCIFHAIEFKYY